MLQPYQLYHFKRSKNILKVIITKLVSWYQELSITWLRQSQDTISEAQYK